MVRCFEDTDVIHVEGSIDALRDIETINLELILADIEVLERRIAKTRRLQRQIKSFWVKYSSSKHCAIIWKKANRAVFSVYRRPAGFAA